MLSAGTAIALNMVNGVMVLYVLDVLRVPAGDYGLVLVVVGAGGLLGGLATPPLARRLGRTAMLTGGAALSGACTLLMATTRQAVVRHGAVRDHGRERHGVERADDVAAPGAHPRALFGRVQGAYRTVVWGAIPLGSLAGGALASVAGIRTVFAVSGVMATRAGRAARPVAAPPRGRAARRARTHCSCSGMAQTRCVPAPGCGGDGERSAATLGAGAQVGQAAAPRDVTDAAAVV